MMIEVFVNSVRICSKLIVLKLNVRLECMIAIEYVKSLFFLLFSVVLIRETM